MNVINTKEKIWRVISCFFLLIEIVIFCSFGFQIQKLVPIKYMILYGSVACVLIIASIFFTFKMVKGAKSGLVVIVFMIVTTSVLLVGQYMIGKAQSTIDNVTANGEEVTSEIILLVRKDSEISNVTDIGEFLVGYLKSDSGFVDYIIEEINSLLGQEPNYVEFEDVFSMVDALYSKTANVIILDKAYMDVIGEVEGYESFQDDVREIYSKEIVNYIRLVEKNKDLTQFVVYVSGIDRFGAVSATSRSDVNLLLAVNTETKEIQMINTPRDYYVPLANSNGVKDKLTHAGLYGVDNSIATLEMLYDVEIDYYVRMNFSGFEGIIDALGGIDVYSEYDFTVEPIKHYTKGINHVTGLEALAFARERHSFAKGDIQRGENQMEVVKATIQKALSKEILYNYTEVLEDVSGIFQTNMTSEEIYQLVKMQLSDMATWDMNTYSVTGTGSMSTTYSMPNRNVYVMNPNQQQVEEAQKLLMDVLEGKDK